MAGALRLEQFDTGPSTRDGVSAEQPGLTEADRSAAWEAGYSAGWDDAVRAQAEDQSRIRADLARSLQDLSFTYHEARSHVLGALEPLLDMVVGKLLPEAARGALGAVVVEELMRHAAEAGSPPVVLAVAPGCGTAMEGVLSAAGLTLPVTLAEEPTLDEGQAILRFGKSDCLIDLTGLIGRLRDGLDALYHTIDEDRRRHA